MVITSQAIVESIKDQTSALQETTTSDGLMIKFRHAYLFYAKKTQQNK